MTTVGTRREPRQLGSLIRAVHPRQAVALDVAPVDQPTDEPSLPMTFDISLAVRRGERALIDRLEEVLDRRRSEIDAILADYHVPRVDGTAGPAP